MQSYSQYGEDLILWDYFKGKPDGLFVEIGANHPTALNNTWFFEQRGWRGILIEPLPDRCRELRQLRHRSQIIEAALGCRSRRQEKENPAEGDSQSRGKKGSVAVLIRVAQIMPQEVSAVQTASATMLRSMLSGNSPASSRASSNRRRCIGAPAA